MVSREFSVGSACEKRRVPHLLRGQLRKPLDRAIRRRMRIAIEAASLSLTSGGLARYTSELSLALARSFPEDEYFLTSDQKFHMPEGAPDNLRRGGGPRNA